jgi:hypothetical protein
MMRGVVLVATLTVWLAVGEGEEGGHYGSLLLNYDLAFAEDGAMGAHQSDQLPEVSSS